MYLHSRVMVLGVFYKFSLTHPVVVSGFSQNDQFLTARYDFLKASDSPAKQQHHRIIITCHQLLKKRHPGFLFHIRHFLRSCKRTDIIHPHKTVGIGSNVLAARLLSGHQIKQIDKTPVSLLLCQHL